MVLHKVMESDILTLGQLLDTITMVSAVGMLALTLIALIYIVQSKNRVKGFSNIIIFVLLVIAFTFETALWAYGYKKGDEKIQEDDSIRRICRIFFAGQFIFQWLSLLTFTLNYRVAEIEIRKVLGQKDVNHHYFAIWTLAISFIIACCATTYFLCIAFEKDFYDSWASSLGEVVTSFIIFMLYGRYVQRINNLIIEMDLDLVKKSMNFCQTLGGVGLLFITACM